MTQAELFLLTICIVGIAIGILGWLSIRAAQLASHAVEDMFNSATVKAHKVIHKGGVVNGYATKDGHVLPLIRGGGIMNSIRYGHRASWWLPLLFAVSWAASLIVLVVVWYDDSVAYGNIVAKFMSELR
jgi:hypothetical protein